MSHANNHFSFYVVKICILKAKMSALSSVVYFCTVGILVLLVFLFITQAERLAKRKAKRMMRKKNPLETNNASMRLERMGENGTSKPDGESDSTSTLCESVENDERKNDQPAIPENPKDATIDSDSEITIEDETDTPKDVWRRFLLPFAYASLGIRVL
jgi:hypothetical protein